MTGHQLSKVADALAVSSQQRSVLKQQCCNTTYAWHAPPTCRPGLQISALSHTLQQALVHAVAVQQ